MKYAPIWLAFCAILGLITPASAAPSLANLPTLAPKTSCAALVNTDLGAAVGAPVSNLTANEVAGDKPYCKVTGTIAPKVNFEVRLPSKGWTQRFLQTGCGGLCGNLRINVERAQSCAPVTNGEVALASTDMGHAGGMMGDESWATDPQARADFAHRGVHVTALAAKALIVAYYGQSPRYSYFSGCSDGGREALIEAQRYPGDFDGIAAGAPALNFTVQNSFYHGWNALSNTGADGRTILNAPDLVPLHAAVLEACDTLDGLKDGQIDDPRQCKFDPASVQCPGMFEPGKCLTAEQVEVVRKFYGGARDGAGKKMVIGGPMPGSELSWAGVYVPRQLGGPNFSEMIALGTMRWLLFDKPSPELRLADWRFDAATLASLEPARRLYNAVNPDLNAFAAQGGKLILWHGWSDPHISPLNTLDYYARVGTAMTPAKRAAFSRLFMLPAMYHCSGGEGPSDFALLNALMLWVEAGKAPDMIVASRKAQSMEGLPGPAPRVREGAPSGMPPMGPGGPPPGMSGPLPGMLTQPITPTAPRTRPVYAYPVVARYKGVGSIDDAVNFMPFTPPVRDDRVIWLGEK